MLLAPQSCCQLWLCGTLQKPEGFTLQRRLALALRAPRAASKVPAGPCRTEHSLPPLQGSQSLQGGQAWLPLGSPESQGFVCVCVFCSPGRLPVFPDQVHTPEIQQFLRVPTLGLHAGLADGTLLHGLYSSLRHFHPPENQRTPETGTGTVVTGRVAVAPPGGSGWAPGRGYTAHFSSEKARAGEGSPSPGCSIALVGNLESLEGLSTAPRLSIKCLVFHGVLHHHAQCSIQTFK